MLFFVISLFGKYFELLLSVNYNIVLVGGGGRLQVVWIGDSYIDKGVDLLELELS